MLFNYDLIIKDNIKTMKILIIKPLKDITILDFNQYLIFKENNFKKQLEKTWLELKSIANLKSEISDMVFYSNIYDIEDINKIEHLPILVINKTLTKAGISFFSNESGFINYNELIITNKISTHTTFPNNKENYYSILTMIIENDFIQFELEKNELIRPNLYNELHKYYNVTILEKNLNKTDIKKNRIKV